MKPHSKSTLIPIVLTVFILGGAWTGLPDAWAASGVSVRKAFQISSKQKIEIRDLFVASGIDERLVNLIPEDVARPQELRNLGLKKADVTIIKNLLVDAYNGENYQRSFFNAFILTYNRTHLARAAKWFRTPLGKRVVELEREARFLDLDERVFQLIKEYQKESPPALRLSLAKKLVTILEDAKRIVDGDSARLKILAPLKKDKDLKKMEAWQEKLKGPFRKEVYDRAVLRKLGIFKSFKDEEWKAYLKFAESPAGIWFYRTLNEAHRSALRQVTRKGRTKLIDFVQSGGMDTDDGRLAMQIFRPGFRYLFMNKRDPFVRLKEAPDIETTVVAKLLETREKKKVEVVEAPRLKKFGPEIQELKNISNEIYKKIKETDADLYSNLDYFAKLFKERKELEVMEDQEYLDTVAFYRDLIEKAQDAQQDIVSSPLQIDYDKIRVTGVVWNGFGKIALVETDDKAGHTLRKGMLVGPNFGVVEEIDEQKMIVNERERRYDGTVVDRPVVVEFFGAEAPADAEGAEGQEEGAADSGAQEDAAEGK